MIRMRIPTNRNNTHPVAVLGMCPVAPKQHVSPPDNTDASWKTRPRAASRVVGRDNGPVQHEVPVPGEELRCGSMSGWDIDASQAREHPAVDKPLEQALSKRQAD